MKKFLTVALAAAAIALCSSAYAGQIWTDGNGDGLPDGGPSIISAPSSNVTVGVWLDAQSFAFTNFLAYIEWSGQCISYVSASYLITGGSNFPIDNFSHPFAIGFGGSGFPNRTGVIQVGNATLHINTAVSCCVSPIIDIYNPYYVFSQLGAGSAYMLFTSNPGTCYNDVPTPRGACCLPDFSCIANATLDECNAAGGTWFINQDCSVCPQPPQREACCFIDGSCVEADLGNCPPGSQPQGVGTTCAGVNCPDLRPRGACCLPDFSCIANALQSECDAAGGVWLAGQDCSACPQPPVLGACCLESGACLDGLTLDQCNLNSGLWFPNALCSQITCPGGTATESKSWGNIKGLYR